MDLNSDKLFDISVNPDANRDERDAAREARKLVQAGLPVPREYVDLIQRFHGRMLGQNRWGK